MKRLLLTLLLTFIFCSTAQAQSAIGVTTEHTNEHRSIYSFEASAGCFGFALEVAPDDWNGWAALRSRIYQRPEMNGWFIGGRAGTKSVQDIEETGDSHLYVPMAGIQAGRTLWLGPVRLEGYVTYDAYFIYKYALADFGGGIGLKYTW